MYFLSRVQTANREKLGCKFNFFPHTSTSNH